MYKLFALILALLLSLIASAGMNISPGTGVHTHSDANSGGGTLTVSGTLSSTKACATGFTRMNPHYCARNNWNGSTNIWTDAIACTARTSTPTLPADAKMAFIGVQWQGLSAGAIGLRANTVNFFTNSSCTASTMQALSSVSFREEVAVAAGATLGLTWDHLFIPLVSANTFYATQSNAGGNGNAEIVGFGVEGYAD